ncbi:MAG: T9SS type A sorting domain-containing protein [Saprospiraceae bacterium]|nr:T9SS type A sorting domain-containing protein [Candidatus Brachybacter algidus]MBK8746967.1 T9SS type A sorting domain-containing protein [Candidatus Brachybacter algidus]
MYKILLINIIFFNVTFLSAQNAVLTTGGNQTGSSGSISYSIGQLAVQQISNSESTLTPGVQQPFEISEIVAVMERLLSLDIVIFPNPTSGNIRIDVNDNIHHDKLQANLTSYNQKVISKFKLESTSQEFDLSEQPSGVYILTISNEKHQYRQFKIIKL